MNNNHQEMTFLEHLEELRWYLIRSIIALVIGIIVSYFFSEPILNILIKAVPEDVTLRILRPTEGFITRLKIAFATGLLFALPYILGQIWKFILPGLYDHEKKYIVPFAFFGSLIFFAGSFFAYIMVLPMALRFLHSFQMEQVHDAWAIGEYISFVIRLLLAFGIIFELPLVTFILTKLGLITPTFLASKRKYSIIVIFILAAILTPPDVFTQMMMAGPLILLYEISIVISKIAIGKKE